MVRLLALSLLLVVSGVARAGTTVEQRALVHFHAGEVSYRAGRWAEAIDEWRAGYALSPRPLFLVDLGQAYRKLGDLDAALECFEHFTREVPLDPRHDEVMAELAELRVELAARTTPPTEPVRVLPVVALAPAPSTRPRRWWIAPVVGGSVVVLGLSLGLGLGLGLRHPANRLDCNAATTIACLRVEP